MILPLLLMLAPLQAPAAPQTDRVAEILASGDGASQATAWQVKSVDEEYAVLRRLKLRPEMQSLIAGDGGKSFDMLEVRDHGKKRELWFDISSFFGKEF